MPIRHRLLAITLVLGCAAAGPLRAQSGILPVSVEARGGVAFPVDDFQDAADGGMAAEVSATWHALPLVGIYGAYQWNRFAWSNMDGRVTDAGYAVGVRLAIPTPLIPIDPWIRAGIVAHQLKAETITDDSRRGIEVGAGLGFPLARGLALTPGVLWTRYQHGSGAADGELLRVRHLRADVGLRLRF